jgi:molybdate transport system ATP-binding protein
VLLLDEPVASLDTGLKERVLPYVTRIRELHRIPALVVSHDIADVFTIANEVVVLDRGKVVDRGEPRTVLASPAGRGAFFQERFENVLKSHVLWHEPSEGLTRVETALGLSLSIPFRDAPAGEAVLLGLLAEDVLVSKEEPAGLSARNVFPGVVRSIVEQDGVAMVEVDAKESIFVRISHGAIRSLGLREGAPVHLVVKTHSIHRLR